MQTVTNDWIDFLKSIYPNASVRSASVTVMKKTNTVEDKTIEIPLNKLFEFYGNLILNGFDKDEALTITATVAANARTN